MAVYKYAPVAQDEREKAAASEAARSSSFSSPSGGGGGIGPLGVPHRRGGGDGDGDDGDSLISKRMPYCMAMLVLLAIVYVLARTENAACVCPSLADKPTIPVAELDGGESGAGGWSSADIPGVPTPPVSPPAAAAQCEPCPSCPVCPAAAPAVRGGGVAELTCADFDVGKCRKESLEQTTPHIIECSEAGEGGSQEVCHLPRPQRYAAVGQKGATLWMTGLSGSGKSTIAKALEEELVLRGGKHVYRLDGDNIRTGLNRDLGFSEADRGESVRRVGETSCLFSDSGTITIVSLVSPYRDARDAVRKRHEDQGIPFFEVFLDVPLEEVQRRDPKGLYKQVEEGKLKGFTGVDAPYEPPLNAELRLPNMEMTIQECVDALIRVLEAGGILTGGPSDPSGLPMPDGDEIIDLHVAPSEKAALMAFAETLPKVLITDIDLNWLQVIGEGWASPLKGFMREGALLQTIHFASLLVDPANTTGHYNFNEMDTAFDALPTHRPPNRVSMSVPIVLPCTGFTKESLESSGMTSAALVTKDGDIVAVINDFEIYANRKEEIVSRVFGVIDPGHPYIAHIYSGGDWLIGGEIQLLDRIRYNDGLDKWRLTATEVREEFAKKGADVVYAFQTRNPTHAGHAYLMRTAGEKLRDQGFKNPVLWLSPLGGWTKPDDVPLDVRVKQHEAVLAEGMLNPDTTVMAIWPSPMIYGGPTEVQFHAKSRRSGGASFFVVGRDPAGMKGSPEAQAAPDDDLYDAEHGRYVLWMSPGVGSMKMLEFSQVYYDKKTHTMTAPDPSRQDDFISISGSKMRQLAAQGAKPCPNDIPSDLLAANCIPPGFMVQTGWDIVCDYYQNVDTKEWVPWSKPVIEPPIAPHTNADGTFGTAPFQLGFTDPTTAKPASPWHDVPLDPGLGDGVFRFIVEIPMYQTAKMEVMKDVAFNPIMQDESKGKPRYYTYGVPFFNYGLLPQTWEDPFLKDKEGHGGDNDPLDVMEVGDGPLVMGTIVAVKVLGSLELIDEGETDHKIIALRVTDPNAANINNMDDLERYKPGMTARLVDWLKMYKTSDGKPPNSLAQDEPTTVDEALAVIQHTHERWQSLMAGQAEHDEDFWLGETPETAAGDGW
ncbi:similar to 3-phosphoadenosine 5-phosphosulfate synthase 2 isoform 2 [Ectocarpus siliculosus]|uniref:Similar to 3-phosphoadenosine 5-phosphosulfate synthase 2 isoform 2 n=1 Tax=Ectocarpus siliculosus TaxID=2880 RepID=D7G0D3_ECTSI|nr:similar to 3-phosphoadenosine 5-phosphosulfate synthase 2 isoform 2 [Ectocarpus siliculosus]|eukprot:CBJ26660.1 similar to 3-phosphoadenosine 5-phosphosulfate synthase 2 isoform 2 [Ectocarpus siliculosus]